MRIPLMPLHAVLFPGMPMPLMIFEERYLRMVDECLSERAPFGVALIRRGREVGGLAAPHEVGTMATIARSIEAEEGLRIIAIGQDRFRVQRLYNDEGLLRADVRVITPAEADTRADPELCQELATMLRQHVQTIFELLGAPPFELRLPEAPEPLSFVVAAHLTAPLPVQQRLLEMDSAAERLLLAREYLSREQKEHAALLAAQRRAVELQKQAHDQQPWLSEN